MLQNEEFLWAYAVSKKLVELLQSQRHVKSSVFGWGAPCSNPLIVRI